MTGNRALVLLYRHSSSSTFVSEVDCYIINQTISKEKPRPKLNAENPIREKQNPISVNFFFLLLRLIANIKIQIQENTIQ